MLIKRIVSKQDIQIRRIKKIIQRGKFGELKTLLHTMRPEDIASSLSRFNDEEKLQIFILLTADTAGTVLNVTDSVSENFLLKNSEDKRLVNIISKLPDNEAADILAQMDQKRSKSLLSLLKDKSVIEKLMTYPTESAGGIMSTRYIAVNQNSTVKGALASIRKFKADDPELYHIIYVVDDDGTLLGFVTLSALLKATPARRISRLYEKKPISVLPSVDQEEVARIVSLYNLINLPVVDQTNKLIGVIYVEDVIDVINDEAAEDFYKMVGINEEEEISDKSIVNNAKIRLPWLITSLIGSLFAAIIIGYFQPTLDRVLALAAFMPVIAAMSGNVGVQSSSIVIRGLATGAIPISHIWKVIFKEFRVGLLIGLIAGFIIGFIVHFWKADIRIIDIGFAVGIAMASSMTVAATVGSLIPFLLKKMGIDPAVATGPFVTTVNDITGLSIYFITANILMS